MTRLKKELRKHGYKLESDYPFLPYVTKDGLTLESVSVKIDENNIVVINEYYDEVGNVPTAIYRDFTDSNIFVDDENPIFEN